MVKLSISGMMTEARDHVLITSRLLERIAFSTFFASFGFTYGPFFIDLDILKSPKLLTFGIAF